MRRRSWIFPNPAASPSDERECTVPTALETRAEAKAEKQRGGATTSRRKKLGTAPRYRRSRERNTVFDAAQGVLHGMAARGGAEGDPDEPVETVNLPTTTAAAYAPHFQ